MSGLALADPTLARAVGSEAKLALRGSASTGGDIAFDALDLSSHDLDAHYSGLLVADEGAWAARGHGAGSQPLRGSRRRRAQGRSAPRRRPRRRAALRRAHRDSRRACDASRHRLSDARPRDRRRPSPDRRRAHDAGRRLRLHRPHRERSAWLGPAQRRFRPRQGGPERRHRRAAGQRSRSARLGQGRDRRHAHGRPRRSRRRAESDPGRGPSARPQDVRRHARGAGGPHHRSDRGERLGLRRHRRPTSCKARPMS